MYRRRRYVVGSWFVVLIVAGALAMQVGKVLGPGDFVLKGSDSATARAALNKQFHQDDQKIIEVVVRNDRATLRDASFRDGVHSVVAKIRADRALRIGYLDDPTISNNRQLISKDGHAVTILASSGLKEQTIEGKIDHLRQAIKTPGFTTYVTGTPALNHDYAVQSKKDLQKGDSVTIPILIVILLLVFGSLVAAGLPLVLAIFSTVLSLALVFVLGHFLDASIYVENVVMFLSIGISIDYSLFIVYRFREELRANNGDVERSVVRTMETAGRAVFFSGLTVAIGLSSLMLTGLSFMVSMGLGGILVPLCAVLVALTLLPALLGMIGPRINRFRVVPSRFLGAGESRIWRRLAGAVMRRPILSGGAVLLVMLGLAFPLTQMNQAFGSIKNEPKVESIRGFIYMRDHFPTTPDPTQVIVQHTGSGSLLGQREIAGIRALEARIRQNPEVARVTGPADFLPANGKVGRAEMKLLTGRYLTADLQYGLISVTPRHEVGTTQNSDMVRGLRHTASAFAAGALKGNEIHIGGAGADYLDFNDALLGHFPLIIAIVLVLTYVFLFFAFGSVILPLKAVLLNLLSVCAAYGMLVLVFQHGVGSGLLGFTPESGVATWVPVMLFAFLFGLSMDYEVFLLSRMRERWLQTGENGESVAFGLEKTGRLITSAAAIMVVAFSGMLIGHYVQLKEFGFGLLASIALDATLIRMILVPSIMELLGEWNWWVPSFLQGFAARASLAETDLEIEEATAA
jgi:RND superfamily putative drug exporter